MRFVYKINSSYDGFYPEQIPARLESGNALVLGWKPYIDQVDLGQEVWVYFRGPQVVPGIYATGSLQAVLPEQNKVILKVNEYTTAVPLNDKGTAAQLATLVAPPGRQVFVLPEDLKTYGFCTLALDASSCAARRCDKCPVWKSLPLIGYEDFHLPPYLAADIADFLPAYWVVPSRCYIPPRSIRLPIRRASETFYEFKWGDKNVAYPLALGMREVLVRQGHRKFDAIVPIPLSPEKESAGELNRPLALARILGELLDVSVSRALSLREPMSKRRVIATQGRYGFEAAYRRALVVQNSVKAFERILLVDDTCTRGSTLTVAFRQIRERSPDCEIVAATAGQMILKPVVVRKSLIAA